MWARNATTAAPVSSSALTGEEQKQIRDAVAMLRRTRTVQLGIPGIRTAEPDLRLERDA